MSEMPTRAQARAQEKSAGPAVRHGRLKQHHPLKALLKIFVAVIAVFLLAVWGAKKLIVRLEARHMAEGPDTEASDPPSVSREP